MQILTLNQLIKGLTQLSDAGNFGETHVAVELSEQNHEIQMKVKFPSNTPGTLEIVTYAKIRSIFQLVLEGDILHHKY